MKREEFNIALDLSLTKDRVTLCLDYINELEDRICDFEAKHKYIIELIAYTAGSGNKAISQTLLAVDGILKETMEQE